MREAIEGAYPEFLADLRDKAVEVLAAFTPDALKAADLLIKFIQKDWAGQQVYFPKGLAFELANRDWEIFREFNGQNLRAICNKYRLSAARVYQIDAACRKIKDKKEQPQLFGGGE